MAYPGVMGHPPGFPPGADAVMIPDPPPPPPHNPFPHPFPPRPASPPRPRTAEEIEMDTRRQNEYNRRFKRRWEERKERSRRRRAAYGRYFQSIFRRNQKPAESPTPKDSSSKGKEIATTPTQEVDENPVVGGGGPKQ
ncbi:hypothetical protein CMUS01_05838 [Colletotrichum musicola]|uniref:Uncharacterized protein n=1 Tax=Colletotrichum musicola TaxID=2175873 RepID=A0A8H6KPG7_9PEZI|nr:hypothetical protein CMUS01_05838 [Colletotrichum musicola]